MSVSFSPNNELLASGGDDNTIRLWNVKRGELKQTLEGHSNVVRSVGFSLNGELLASGSDDRSIVLWNAYGKLNNLNIFSEILSLAWKQNPINGEAYLATGHFDASVSYWRVIQIKNVPCFELLWSSKKPTQLLLENANIEGTQGLSLLNEQLLAQRGAKDKPNMIQSLTTAAEQGDANAQAELGKLYLEGKEVTQDLNKAIQFFTKAAQQKHPLAAFQLGVCYENGEGVTQDVEVARQWYAQAIKLGNKEAATKLEALAEKINTSSAVQTMPESASSLLGKVGVFSVGGGAQAASPEETKARVVEIEDEEVQKPAPAFSE